MKDSDTSKHVSNVHRFLKAAPPRHEPTEQEAMDTYTQAHAISREVLMLDVRLASGEIVSFPYSALRKARYLATGVIEMRFDDDLVIAEGRNLIPLRDSITRHRQRFIEEGTTIEHGTKDADAMHVERIEIRKVEDEL